MDCFARTFLTSPDGAFDVSQDADVISGRHRASIFSLGDEKRRAFGIPRIDKHLYACENVRLINALARLYAVKGDASPQAKVTASSSDFLPISGTRISIRISNDENEKGLFLGRTSEYLGEESHRARGMCQ